MGDGVLEQVDQRLLQQHRISADERAWRDGHLDARGRCGAEVALHDM